ncbi:hypothetical protein PSHT_03516 [Puccinia striiformis]|uniref:Uncharacterized protein n=2 Tax=Puccinia striiformis TaxID=27350 RepID=A0A2S4WFA2_9BASI|nr:hypothetical protein PSTT_02237 [Puccinia striiformis]POW20431.1 hypothetical protein PSHT_03516 [Puccinia striiformis]
MSSGFSYSEFKKCYAAADFLEDSHPQVEDYNECLTHLKEIAQAKTLQENFFKKHSQQLEKEKVEENVTWSGIISLGILSPA